MRKLLIFIVLVMFSVFAVAQNMKKVAVWETKCSDNSITSFQSTMVRGGMETAVGNTPGFKVYDRSAFDAIMKEQNFQRSGAVKDSDIKRLGEMTGVKYIIVPEAISSGSEFYIIVKMLDVETGEFGGVYEELCGQSGAEIKSACARLGSKLFGNKSATYNNGGSTAIKSPKDTKSSDKTNSLNTIQSSNKGVFSVSSTKKVNFSKGNLQYQASTKTWRFAENQWDIIGDDNKNISPSYSGWIDMFGWGTGDDPTKISKEYSDFRIFNDWGDNTISNGGGKSWFTLTDDEWMYVFVIRKTKSGIRYAKANVNGVNGVILLPDNWSNSNYSLVNTNKSNASFTNNSISKYDWTSKLEANGAVFLPAAGSRYLTNVGDIGMRGLYWSSTLCENDNTNASILFFGPSFVNSSSGLGRRTSISVRLVSLVK